MATATTEVAFDPKGKTFKERLDAMIQDASKTHGVTIKKDSGRTAEWQQKLHVAHMFLYNKYENTTPAKTEAGKRTIAWDHISDASVIWATTQFTDILRTKTAEFPVKDGTAWKKDYEPDKAKTEERAKALLKAEGVGNNGEAMVSSGLKPCGEPCCCGAGRSKHLEESAADLNSTDLGILKTKLQTANAGSLDDYLKKFGLNRPLVNHATSPEEWHVESI